MRKPTPSRPWDSVTLGSVEQLFEQARKQILSAVSPLEAVDTDLLSALGQVLSRDVVASQDVPPRETAAMDGYAVRSVDVASARAEHPVVLLVSQEIAAGAIGGDPIAPGEAARIMTGAPVPPNADAVVPFEHTDEDARGSPPRQIGVRIAPTIGANVRPAGEDLRAGDVALPRGTILGPPRLGVLASLGIARAPVHRRPRVGVLSTGDELIAPGQPAAAGRVYDANGATLAAGVAEAGGLPVSLGIAPDQPEVLERVLRGAAGACDLIVTSAGVSRGDYDLVKDVLRRLGRMAFWEVRMKPGRPLAFGWLGDTPLVGLPGNPVAAAVGFEQFVRPAIRKMLGATDLFRPEVAATIRGSATNRDGRRCFLRARLEWAESGYVAALNPRQGSGRLTSLSWANALVVIPEDVSTVSDGDRLAVQILGTPD